MYEVNTGLDFVFCFQCKTQKKMHTFSLLRFILTYQLVRMSTNFTNRGTTVYSL